MAAQWLLIIIGLLFVVILAMNHFVRANPAVMARALRRFAVGAIIVVGLLLIVTGRLPWQSAIGLLFVLIINALFGRRSRAGTKQTSTPGQSSEVTTRFLRMALDHDTGELDGTVLEGRFKGRALSSMSLEELRSFVGVVSEDADSLNVLAAYLDRTYGDKWRKSANGADGGEGATPSGAMTRDEAYKVLGLSPGASDDQIRAAHRRLMKLSHPDHGGSDYLASKINEAKDTLLHESGRRT